MIAGIISKAEFVCLIALFMSLFLHMRRSADCSVADLLYLIGLWGFVVCGFFLVWVDVTAGKFGEAGIDASMSAFFAFMALLYCKTHHGDHWRNGWKKLRRAGGAKAKAIRAKLVKKLRDTVKRGRPSLRPVPA